MKSKYRKILIVGLIIICAVIGILMFTIWGKDKGGWIGVMFIVCSLFVVGVFMFFSRNVKWLIAKNYMKYLNENIKYSPDNNLFPLSVESFYKESGLLNYYQYVDLEEDSISFKTDSFELYWEEIETSIRVKTKNWESRRTTNHCYIMLIKILKHRFPIKKYVKLMPDKFDSLWKKLFYCIMWWGAGAFILGVGSNVILEWKFKYSLSEHKITVISVLLGILWFLIWAGLALYFVNRKRIELENVEFEKIFDVYSDDEIEARRLLTPKMMEKLVNFAKKSKFKWLAFNFVEDKIYIKFDVNKFLEISLFWKDIKDQIRDFFYQIMLIVDFVNRLNIEYFSEVEFLKDRQNS